MIPSGLAFSANASNDWQSKQEDECVLVEADEEKIEEQPDNWIFKTWSLSEYFPTVVLFSFPEFQAVTAASSKVEGETCSPDTNQNGHQHHAIVPST